MADASILEKLREVAAKQNQKKRLGQSLLACSQETMLSSQPTTCAAPYSLSQISSVSHIRSTIPRLPDRPARPPMVSIGTHPAVWTRPLSALSTEHIEVPVFEVFDRASQTHTPYPSDIPPFGGSCEDSVILSKLDLLLERVAPKADTSEQSFLDDVDEDAILELFISTGRDAGIPPEVIPTVEPPSRLALEATVIQSEVVVEVLEDNPIMGTEISFHWDTISPSNSAQKQLPTWASLLTADSPIPAVDVSATMDLLELVPRPLAECRPLKRKNCENGEAQRRSSRLRVEHPPPPPPTPLAAPVRPSGSSSLLKRIKYLSLTTHC